MRAAPTAPSQSRKCRRPTMIVDRRQAATLATVQKTILRIGSTLAFAVDLAEVSGALLHQGAEHVLAGGVERRRVRKPGSRTPGYHHLVLSDTRSAAGDRESGRTDEEGQELCLACGMCCNGDLFVNVWLHREEVDSARQIGLPIVRNARGDPAFAQPCPKHVEGLCTVYDDTRKPHSCDSFDCKLLRRYLRGEIGREESLDCVRQARTRIDALREKIGRENDVSIWRQLIEWSEGAEGPEPEIRMEIGVLIHLLDKMFLPPDAEADVASWPPEKTVRA